jgi:branched-chain amino acid transport system permease protein
MGTAIAVIWAGLVSGAIYCLIGLAYLLVFRATRVLNFSLGGTAGLAGIAAGTATGQPTVVAVAFGIMIAVTGTLVIDAVVTRPVQARDSGHFGAVLALAAALFVVIQFTGHVFTQESVLGTPLMSGGVTVAGETVSYQGILTVLLTVGACAAAFWWLRSSRSGRLLAALGDDVDAARVLCLPVAAVRIVAVAVAGLVTGLAGVLYIGRSPMDFQTGFDLSLLGFLAVVIGGLASVWGSLVGGLMLGLLQSAGAWLIGARWFDYLLVGVVVLAFRLRPQGIFSTSVRDWD